MSIRTYIFVEPPSLNLEERGMQRLIHGNDRVINGPEARLHSKQAKQQ